MEEEEEVDDAAEGAVEAVDGLVGGTEGVGEGVEGFEGEEGLDGELGGGDEAEALGYVGVVWGVLVTGASWMVGGWVDLPVPVPLTER